ncbi:MAG: AAA family ATPase [Salinivirgaceae bacterium]|nr:AAA family ATPase [Salinivirgaceae bacterium]
MNRENQLKLFKDFIVNCTTNANSLKNYIDFKRINECLQQLFPKTEDVSILDFDDAKTFEKITNRLDQLESYVDFNVKGKNQYSTTVGWYQRFLNAKNIFSKQEEIISNIKNTTDLPLQQIYYESPNKDIFLPYLTALRTKPFMLLAGISGTGKSRIVRELAKSCWKDGDEEYGKNNPRNFCMVQVKPNWHDSSELIGYVSRINGEKYVVGPFLKFMAKAINEPDTPYFLCLDEMNLAPVEQYFAEYLSVIESRKLNANGCITTDPIIDFEPTDAYKSLIDQLFPEDDATREEYLKENNGKRLTIPQNLFVVGTVNMDETTFSFSRKVLDRAMTIEMNEVDLHGGLTDGESEIGYIGNCIIGNAAEGKDVYADNQELCDKVLEYLGKVNAVLEGTPFKIAYRTRNEFLMYAVNRQWLDDKSQLWQTLDEMTSMKILSRIEGDSERTQGVLGSLKNLVENEIAAQIPDPEEGKAKAKSISAAKIEEMIGKLNKSGYTSYWA